VYIVNEPTAASATNSNGGLIRWRIDRGQLVNKFKSKITDYLPYLDSDLIKEFISIRNAHAHYWKIPVQDDQWPRDQLRDKAFAWPHHDPKFSTYTGWTPITAILTEHLNAIIDTQDKTFELMISDITKFETNNGVTIV